MGRPEPEETDDRGKIESAIVSKEEVTNRARQNSTSSGGQPVLSGHLMREKHIDV